MSDIKRKLVITLAFCLAIVFLMVLIIKSKEDIVTFHFYGQNDCWEVNIVYTINQDSKTIKRSSILISKVDQSMLTHLDITISDDNSWITTESLELSKGMVEGEEKLSTYDTNYDKNKMSVDLITVHILINNSDKQSIHMKKIEKDFN